MLSFGSAVSIMLLLLENAGTKPLEVLLTAKQHSVLLGEAVFSLSRMQSPALRPCLVEIFVFIFVMRAYPRSHVRSSCSVLQQLTASCGWKQKMECDMSTLCCWEHSNRCF